MWILNTLIAAVLFAASSMINKYALRDGSPVDRLLPGTFLAGFLLLLAYYGRRLPPLGWPLPVSGLAMSLFSMLNCIAILLALRHGPVGGVAAVAGSHSVITPVLALVLFRQDLNGWQWLSVALATVAMILVVNKPGSSVRKGSSWGWFLLALLGAMGSSGETLVLDHAVALQTSGGVGLVWSYLFSFIFVSIWFVRRRQSHFGRGFYLGAADGAVSAIGMIFFANALHGGPAGLVAALSTSAVVLRALGGSVFFHDELPARAWIGVTLAVAAFALVSLFG